MRKKIIERFINLYELIKEKTDHKVIIFIFFLFISAFSWFLNALNQKYTTEIDHPVKYINFPSNKILINELPTHLNLFINSYGYDILLKHKLRLKKKRIVFDLSSNLLNKSTNSDSKYYIITNNARDKISNQIASELHLLEVRPDSIIFIFSNAISKKVKIKPDIEINLEKQYMIKNGINSVPDSITVSGPNHIIDTLQYIYTKFQKFNKVDEPISKSLSLNEIKSLKYDHKKVDVIINVEQYTETFTTAPIKPQNLPDSLSIKVFPNTITIYFNIPLSDFNKINPSIFEAFVDFKEANFNSENQPDFLTVNLNRYPDFIQSIRYNPKKVEYIIEKND